MFELGARDDVSLVRRLAGFDRRCKRWSDLRHVRLRFHGDDGEEIDLTLEPRHILIGTGWDTSGADTTPPNNCEGGLVPGTMFGSSVPFDWILGNAFLRCVGATIFDPSKKRVGFLSHRAPPASAAAAEL